jgi:hypothetical protein
MINMHTGTIKMFRWGDLLIALVLLAGVLFSTPLIASNKPENVEIYRDNEKVAEYPLYTDRSFPIGGVLGTLMITIKNNSVSITSSNCPHHLCMQIGSIHHSNEQIICAPNHILITISSAKETNGPDGIAR